MKVSVKYPLIILALCCALPAVAENDTQFEFNVWTSHGQTKWRHDASMLDPDYGVPTSELDYQGLHSNIAEVSALKHLQTGHQIRFTFGTGTIDDGLLVDDDYFSATGAANNGTTVSGAHRFSRTHSDIDGNNLFYMKAEFLPKNMLLETGRLQAQVGFGLHYWEEEYTATGIRQLEYTLPALPEQLCPPLGTRTDCSGMRVITNNVQWTGLGVGFDSKLAFTSDLNFNINFSYYPIMSLVNEDIHHLRSDLSQDPSVRMSGKGSGYDLLARLNWQLGKDLSVSLGYQRWLREVEDQNITFYGASGGASTANLMNFRTWREGFKGGVTLVF